MVQTSSSLNISGTNLKGTRPVVELLIPEDCPRDSTTSKHPPITQDTLYTSSHEPVPRAAPINKFADLKTGMQECATANEISDASQTTTCKLIMCCYRSHNDDSAHGTERANFVVTLQ